MNTGWVKAREPLFDALFGLLAAFYTSYQEFLKPDALLARLNEDGQIKLVDYLSNLLTDPTITDSFRGSGFFRGSRTGRSGEQ